MTIIRKIGGVEFRIELTPDEVEQIFREQEKKYMKDDVVSFLDEEDNNSDMAFIRRSECKSFVDCVLSTYQDINGDADCGSWRDCLEASINKEEEDDVHYPHKEDIHTFLYNDESLFYVFIKANVGFRMYGAIKTLSLPYNKGNFEVLDFGIRSATDCIKIISCIEYARLASNTFHLVGTSEDVIDMITEKSVPISECDSYYLTKNQLQIGLDGEFTKSVNIVNICE